jgi:hypothetical protein
MPDGTSRFSLRGQADRPLHGLLAPSANYTVAARDRARQDPCKDAPVRQGLLRRLRRHHRRRRGDLHGQGRSRRQRAWCSASAASASTSSRAPEDGGSRHDHRRRRESVEREASGPQVRHDPLSSTPRITRDVVDHLVAADRGRRRLQLRLHRATPRSCVRRWMHAHRGWGREHDHRRGRSRRKEISHAAVPAGHRPQVWRGSAFGGARGRTDTPKIVDWYMERKINIDPT